MGCGRMKYDLPGRRLLLGWCRNCGRDRVWFLDDEILAVDEVFAPDRVACAPRTGAV